MRDDYQNAIENDFGAHNTQGVEINAIEQKRLDSNYTNKDTNWNTDTYSRDIYISTPNDTHNQIVNHHAYMNEPGYDGRYNLPEDGKYPGVSGFFTNEDTASKSFTDDGKFNSISLGQDLQQAPYYDDAKAKFAELSGENYTPEYNGNLDCFQVNPEKMQGNYGTTDFYAAMSSCTENKVWGEGGGFQGYNPYINEMINNGSLEYVPEKSRSCDYNECMDYADRKNKASSEAQAVNNHIESNNIHGTSGERLGYNEISHNNDVKISNNNIEASGFSSNNIEAITGGGSHAPPSSILGGNGSSNPSDCDISLPKTNAANPNDTTSISPVSSSINKGSSL